MIYLTGDVHSLNTLLEQNSQVIQSRKYLEILKKYEISCTLFINGICLDKERKDVQELLKFDVELGGHTYDNFGKMNLFKSYLNRKFFGCIYGSGNYQRKDISKTKKAFENFGLKMTSWRTHAFGSNKKTFEILNNEEIFFVSDLIGDITPFRKKIIHLPINIPVDQNTISYGNLTPKNRDPFASCVKGRINAEEWFEIIKKRITANEKNKIDSILLIHPQTMAVLDNFKLFEEIAKYLSKYKSGKISEFRL